MKEITLSQAIRICENINELTGIYTNLMDLKLGRYYWRPFLHKCPLRGEACVSGSWNGKALNSCARGLLFLSEQIEISGQGKTLLSVGPFIISDSGEAMPKGSKASGIEKYAVIHITQRQLDALQEMVKSFCSHPPAVCGEANVSAPMFTVEQEFSGDDRGAKLGSSNSVIRQLTAHIYQHLEEELTLDWAVEYTHFSKSYLCRIFKQELDTTFRDYVNTIRIEQSKLYLKQQKYQISEIARLTGFSDQNYFSRVFKQFEGVTPSQYRINQS